MGKVRDSVERLTAIAPDDASSWPDDLSEPARVLLDYWRAKCRDGAFPDRSEIEPRHIVNILPYVFIVERLDVEPSDYCFRLVGTGIADIKGDLTGRRLSELFPDRDRHAKVWRQYDDACCGAIFVRSEGLGWRGKEFVRYKVVLLPLRGPHGAVRFLIGTAHGLPLPDGSPASRSAPERFPIPDYPAVSLGTDGIVTVDYTSAAIAASPEAVKYVRQRIFELAGGRAMPVLVFVEALLGIGGKLQATLSEPEHIAAVRASAVVAKTPAGRKMAEALLDSYRSPYPMQTFESVAEARSWLRDFS